MSREDRLTVQLTGMEATMVHALLQWAIRNDGLEGLSPKECVAVERARDKVGQVVAVWLQKKAVRGASR